MAPSVRKAFEVLKVISLSQKGAGVNKIARDSKMAKSTVHGITLTLEDLGAIIRDPLTKRYTLGLTLFELGRLAYSQIDLKDMARPIMEDLMERAQESVFFGVLNGDRVTILDIVESKRDLKITSPIGTTIPILAGATGKVFLAFMEEENAKEIIREKGLTRYTENTIIDPEKYLHEIRRVRGKGYATDHEEYILGVRAVVSPIKGDRHLMSALWVVGFRTSLNSDKMKALIEMTKEAAEAVSRNIEDKYVG